MEVEFQVASGCNCIQEIINTVPYVAQASPTRKTAFLGQCIHYNSNLLSVLSNWFELVYGPFE